MLPRATLYCTSGVAGPAQRPGIHKVAAVSSSSAWISTGKVVFVAIGAVETAIAIAKRDGPSISSQNQRQPS